MNPTEEEWFKAVEHFVRSRAPYVNGQAIGDAECIRINAQTYKPLIHKYHGGDRSRELLNAMMALPIKE